MNSSRFGRLQTRSLLWMISGLVIWSVHFVAVYVLMSLGCALSFATAQLAGMSAINLVLLILTAVLLAAILYLGWASLRQWQLLRGSGAAEQNAAFMALAATLIHAIPLLAVIYVGLPLLISPPCI
jgi:hypothetical protein